MNDSDPFSSNASISDFFEIVRNLIAYFILRQQLVLVAMVDVNPKFLYKLTQIDIEPYAQLHRERLLDYKRAKAEGKLDEVPTLPIWKGDWECFAHGHGCRLTHLRTGEPIEWDTPDAQGFRIDWFMNHLEWRLKNELHDPYVQQCNHWLKSRQEDTDAVQKAVYAMIDLGIVSTKQNHICTLAGNQQNMPQRIIDLSDEVINAMLNSLLYYRQRQEIAILAMIDLRPDFIFQVVNDSFTSSETAERLHNLCSDIEKPPERKSKIQSGMWQEIWEYDIRYATVTLTHKTTSEIIRWTVSDPLLIDYSGYNQHLLWRNSTNNQDQDTEIMHQWMRLNAKNQRDVDAQIYQLIRQLVARDIIALTRNTKGLMLRLNNPKIKI